MVVHRQHDLLEVVHRGVLRRRQTAAAKHKPEGLTAIRPALLAASDDVKPSLLNAVLSVYRPGELEPIRAEIDAIAPEIVTAASGDAFRDN